MVPAVSRAEVSSNLTAASFSFFVRKRVVWRRSTNRHFLNVSATRRRCSRNRNPATPLLQWSPSRNAAKTLTFWHFFWLRNFPRQVISHCVVIPIFIKVVHWRTCKTEWITLSIYGGFLAWFGSGDQCDHVQSHAIVRELTRKPNRERRTPDLETVSPLGWSSKLLQITDN